MYTFYNYLYDEGYIYNTRLLLLKRICKKHWRSLFYSPKGEFHTFLSTYAGNRCPYTAVFQKSYCSDTKIFKMKTVFYVDNTRFSLQVTISGALYVSLETNWDFPVFMSNS